MNILITGGAGFVGSSLARQFIKRDPTTRVTALDNLRRRGSELNVASFKHEGIRFVHGDIRCPSDLDDLNDTYDLFIEASAEPSVQAGLSGSPAYVIDTNLRGTVNCLEYARRKTGRLVFLSTSRVYSVEPLRSIALEEGKTRLVIGAAQTLPGVTPAGIAEFFPVDRWRSFYGAAKLASEYLVQEYVQSYGLKAVIDRCGVIAGPGQFGKVDQGVFTLWVAHHYFGKPLKYTGFGGKGKQVRDLLHPEDLFELVMAQFVSPQGAAGEVFNVGGGPEVSASLLEYTALCREATGRPVEVESQPATHSADIPLYLSDNGKVNKAFGWRPRKSAADIVSDIQSWIKNNEAELKNLFE